MEGKVNVEGTIPHMGDAAGVREESRDFPGTKEKAMDTVIGNFRNWDYIREKIRYRVVNEAEEDSYRGKIYEKILDLLKIYYVPVWSDDKSSACITIDHVHRRKFWGVSMDEIRAAADANMCTRQYSLVPVSDVLSGTGIPVPETGMEPQLYVLKYPGYGNAGGGAAVMLDTDILAECAKKIADGSDMYLLPSSRYEVLLLKAAEDLDVRTLREIVHDVNREQVEESDRLSDNVYYFSAKEKRLTIRTGMQEEHPPMGLSLG